MRRIAIAFMSTVTGLVLLFSYHTSTGQASSAGAAGTGSDTGSGASSGSSAANGSGTNGSDDGSGSDDGTGPDDGSGSSDSSSGASGSSGSSGSNSGGSPGGTAVTGDAVDTRWGPVQVRITVANGKIVSSEAIQYPNNNGHDMRINSYAVPILNQQAVQAQNAQLDGVSGATVTSDGYRQSLQSAIDQAHLG